MLINHVIIQNKLGLHARASAKLVAIASKYNSDIFIQKDNQTIDGKSIMAVMMLSAKKGTELMITTKGQDEIPQMEAILALINDLFGEGI
jgi:phosphocarrier protein HPr